MDSDFKAGAGLGTVLLLGAGLVGALSLWGCPTYNVYSAKMRGEAEMAQADANRGILVREAQAKKDAAVLLADAEVERAKGVAAANKIIGEGLRDNEAYLRYLWVTGIGSGNREIIYIPTEANIPIMEAGRGVAPLAPTK